MPNLICLLGQSDPLRFAQRFRRIEQAQLHSRCMLGEEREVYPGAIEARAKRRRRAGPHAADRLRMQSRLHRYEACVSAVSGRKGSPLAKATRLTVVTRAISARAS